MRLLDVDNYQIYTFYGEDIPPYAILSHTWETEEVTFDHIQNLDECKNMIGFKKIQYACKQAASENLRYVWIDTCCIDKSSSSELSEAINTMFRWYMDAANCYVYLVDVEKGESEFTESRWWTRAWTLQELLAPKQVHFFDSTWNALGTKQGWLLEISIRTKIAHTVLLNPDNIARCSIAQRMSWASGRDATRIEDTAYSLLGLFNINMSLIYGEGQRAFLRLQEEILKTSQDQSIFAWGYTNSVLEHTVLNNKVRTVESRYGAFAYSPDDFSNSARVKPMFLEDSSGSYFMTNRGLRMDATVVDLAPKDLLLKVVLLNCYLEGLNHYCIGFFIQSCMGSNCFTRVTCSSDSQTFLVPLKTFISASNQRLWIPQPEMKIQQLQGAPSYSIVLKSGSLKVMGYQLVRSDPSNWEWDANNTVAQFLPGKPFEPQLRLLLYSERSQCMVTANLTIDSTLQSKPTSVAITQFLGRWVHTDEFKDPKFTGPSKKAWNCDSVITQEHRTVVNQKIIMLDFVLGKNPIPTDISFDSSRSLIASGVGLGRGRGKATQDPRSQKSNSDRDRKDLAARYLKTV